MLLAGFPLTVIAVAVAVEGDVAQHTLTLAERRPTQSMHTMTIASDQSPRGLLLSPN